MHLSTGSCRKQVGDAFPGSQRQISAYLQFYAKDKQQSYIIFIRLILSNLPIYVKTIFFKTFLTFWHSVFNHFSASPIVL